MKTRTPAYGLVFGLSYLSLLWERLWNRFWATASLLLFFIALSLLNTPQLLSAAGHIAFLGLFTAALAVLLLRAQDPFALPSRSEVERRMEKAAALAHRPLETLRDTPVETLAEDSLALWQAHLKKTAGRISRLKIYTPQPTVSTRDRFAFRHAAMIFLAVGLAVAQGDAGLRIRQALSPDLGSLVNKKTATLDLWIIPPAYTHKAAIFLSKLPAGASLPVPAGSLLKLHATGYRRAPGFAYAGKPYPLTATAAENFSLELPLTQSGALRLTSWLSVLGQWSLTVVPDAAPETQIVTVAATPQASTKITYQAHDDYGIAELSGIIENPDKERYLFNMPDESSHVEDLSAHLWAGLPVTLTLTAEDAAGHKTVSDPYPFILPERRFTNPVAQRLIEERKALSHAKNTLIRNVIAARLMDIAADTALYKDDTTLFLALASAPRRLMYDGSGEAVVSVQALLWDVALKLEDGGLSLAQRELRDALQKMSAALNDKNMSRQQLQALLEEVQQKMQHYVQSLATEMQQRLQQGKNVPVLSPDIAQKFMKSIDLEKMLAQMQQMLQADSREDLQKITDSLKNTIDNLDMKKFDALQEKQMQAMETLQNLDALIHRQQKLFDDANKAKSASEAEKQAQEQAAIRRQLGESMRLLGESTGNIPDNFARADQSMKRSGEALGNGLPKDSLPHQKAALDELQKGLDDAIKKIAQSMQQSIMSFGLMPGGGNFGKEFDPLGRNAGNGEETKIPDQNDRRRVQEIIEELRNRSNEPNRTKVERDYLERLLDRF